MRRAGPRCGPAMTLAPSSAPWTWEPAQPALQLAQPAARLLTRPAELLDPVPPQLQDQDQLQEEGRGRKKLRKRMLMQLLVGLKVLAAGIVLPAVVALALFASWKGITVSLLAFMLAGIVGLKGLFSSIHPVEKQHIIVSKPSEHWWRKDEDYWEKDPYRGHI